MLRQLTRSLALLPALAFAACSSPNLDSTPCQTAADCPAGQGCSAQGYCAPLLPRASGSGSGAQSNGGATAAQSSSGNQQTSSGVSTAGNGASSGGVSTAGNGASSGGVGGAGNGSAGNGSAGIGSSSGSSAGGNGASSSSSSSGGVQFTGGGVGGFGGGGSSSGGGSTSSGSGGGTTTGAATSIGPQGGSMPSLVFAVVGDTRPQNEGDTANYPTQDINWIYQNITAASPRPQFVVGTGDYAFCSGSDCAAQTANYMAAAKQYTDVGGQVYLAMGNHECTGYTRSNCGPNNTDGITPNFTNFFNMLTTFGITNSTQPTIANQEPYYEVDVNSSDSTNPWTSKFVFVAANAWDSAQSSWLTSVMQKTTTYTFVVRHESWEDDGAASSNQPGDQGASDQIINQYPYTALLVGHTHEYRQSSSGSSVVELIVGNGGAQSSGPPGYVICQQVTGGNISCQPYNAGTTPSTNGSAVVMNAAGALQ